MDSVSILSKFDMEPGKGLIRVTQPGDAANDSEVLGIEEAKKFKADAIYFRRYREAVYSVPQVYIYEKDFSDEDLAEVHTKLWSSGAVPLFYVVTDSHVKIFNCTKSVEIKKGGYPVSYPLKVFNLMGSIQDGLEYKKFSAKLFDNGTFWEASEEILNVANSPYQKLLDSLLAAKRDLEKKYPKRELASSTINKLLIIGILVRYLEEKEDENGVKLLEISRDLYYKFPGCEQFTDILRKGYILSFLKELDDKFNGKIFDLNITEKRELARADLNFVAAVFDADIESKNKQHVIWKLYSFNYLPIELISGIYEAFLKKEKGVVYTPPFLVNALIDECMPLHKAEELFKEEAFKVLDPACGSGIFLVAALKRMMQWKAILHFKSTGEVSYPGIDVIQQIIKNNIFGIDIEEGATLISNFSICIALCDKLSPMQIWNELRFDEDIGNKNIRTANFFELYDDIQQNENYDLVIGNPPFNPPSGFANKAYIRYIKNEFKVEPNHPLNDDNLALFFWDKAAHLRKPGGKICFILPSAPWLYNNNSFEYRQFFFQNFQVSRIIDFTHLSDRLFHRSTNVAVCATIAFDMEGENPNDLLHIVVKRSRVAEERFYFEVDHYDFHQVNYKTALENPFVWKANLLGGGRLLRLVNYLNNLRSLGEFLKEKEKEGWVCAEGYIIGNNGNNGKKAEWITGKNTVVTDLFTEKGIGKIDIEEATRFYRRAEKNKAIFKPPHILIKENLGQERIPMVFSEEYLCFKHEIIGIHSSHADRDKLTELYENLKINSSTYRFYLLSTSSRAGVSRSISTLLKSDIMSLPYPQDQGDLHLGHSETIIRDDVLEYYIKSNAASINSPLNQSVDDKTLCEYGEVFCKVLNPIYEQKGQKWFVRGFKHEKTEAVVAYVFCYGMPGHEVLPEILDEGLSGIGKLLYNSSRRNIRITRVLREYLHIDGYDVLILIKPKFLRYWLRSIALRDADETFTDLKRTGF